MPTIVFKDGEPYIAIGAPGGSRLMTSTSSRCQRGRLRHGHEDRRDVPRFHSEEGRIIFVEPALPESTAEALRALGNEIERTTYMSRVQAIRFCPEEGEPEARADPRGGGGVGKYP